jgi:hypothetical protein
MYALQVTEQFAPHEPVRQGRMAHVWQVTFA